MDNGSNLPDLDFRADRHAANGPSQPCLQQQTPPASDIGSPDTKAEASDIDSQDAPGVQRLPYRATTPPKGASMRLPSLEAFDRGVEALARFNGRTNDRSCSILLPSPIPLLAYKDGKSLPPPRLLWSPRGLPDDSPNTERSASPPEGVTGLGIRYFGGSHGFYGSHGSYPYHAVERHLVSHHGRPTTSCLRSPSPDDNYSHNNQQYTTEEGDFIIYARHDKKLKWSRVEQEFAAQFGHSPKRTVQGLQAWHYRMNNHIPVWDEHGWLCFDSEDGDKPRETSIKSRHLNSHGQPLESLGIAQRYPERAVNYTWVDPKTKMLAKDWAAKRALQFEIRERRRRKQLRRVLAAQLVE
ncbi:hypothetical protein F53441_4917 [Fusarium austroafricanum]|uniref:Uncharacterized protein n=1 Tax=Fusarium austroafricanum TaxID=2364996 RepID=A0A8H4P059_9HYPO|nr:hypothetical protein F53441_4917 [Fusarium austroafricanum]